MRRAFAGPLLGALALVVVTGCSGSPGQDQAKAACGTYRNTGLEQTATTAAEYVATVATARRQIRAAGATDPRWAALSQDMQDALSRRTDGSISSGEDFLAVDRRVQAECKRAGREIGDLVP